MRSLPFLVVREDADCLAVMPGDAGFALDLLRGVLTLLNAWGGAITAGRRLLEGALSGPDNPLTAGAGEDELFPCAVPALWLDGFA